MTYIVFHLMEEEVGYSAKDRDRPIFTQGDSFEEVWENMHEACEAFGFDRKDITIVVKLKHKWEDV